MGNPILSYNEQQGFKKISSNNKGKYEPLALEVESLELEKLLGLAFLQDIQNNPNNYTNLLSPYQFKNCNGDNVTHRGLKFVIAYFNYSRYIGESFVSDTYSGMVAKNRDDSTRLTEGEIKRLQSTSREIAMNAWLTIKEYLDLNTADYPLWDYCETKKVYRPKIFGSSKTKYLNNARTVQSDIKKYPRNL